MIWMEEVISFIQKCERSPAKEKTGTYTTSMCKAL